MDKLRFFFVLQFLFLVTITYSQKVYITKSGEKYHLGNCKYLSKSAYEVDLASAQKRGYKPCTICTDGIYKTESSHEAKEEIKKNTQSHINTKKDTIEYVTQDMPTPEEELEKKEIITEAPLTIVEDMPTFPGGDVALKKFIQKNLLYPASLKESSIAGTCYVTFIVEKDGTLSDIKILRGISGAPECSEEAIRLVKSMPNWIPGRQNNNIVRVQYNLAIKFTL